MNILLFGILKEKVGSSVIQLSNSATVAEIKKQIDQKYPALINESYCIAVNETIVDTSQSISETDTIALLPPFSGG
ncbi:MAG: MoaD/ThiS family protein [Bacteroidota bacterium]|nr:MoaD/ThiS family protein [Bacteroidota bacterium]